MCGWPRWSERLRNGEYPSSELGLRSLTSGQADLDLAVLHIEIAGWDVRGGESRRSFRRRVTASCQQAWEEYVKGIEAQGWTRRTKLARLEYIEGLALWQCGESLEQIQRRLAGKGVNVGRPWDRSGILHGIERVAQYLANRTPRGTEDRGELKWICKNLQSGFNGGGENPRVSSEIGG
jgi:hypothetical protein